MRAVVLGFCLVLVLGETVHIVRLACLSESMVRTKFENTKKDVCNQNSCLGDAGKDPH